jgi:hypothetical protein
MHAARSFHENTSAENPLLAPRAARHNQRRTTGVEIEHRTDHGTGEMSTPALQPCRPLRGGAFVPAQSSRPAMPFRTSMKYCENGNNVLSVVLGNSDKIIGTNSRHARGKLCPDVADSLASRLRGHFREPRRRVPATAAGQTAVAHGWHGIKWLSPTLPSSFSAERTIPIDCFHYEVPDVAGCVWNLAPCLYIHSSPLKFIPGLRSPAMASGRLWSRLRPSIRLLRNP